jgi:hypothetical protein
MEEEYDKNGFYSDNENKDYYSENENEYEEELKEIEYYNKTLEILKYNILIYVNEKSLPLCEYLSKRKIQDFLNKNVV